MRKSRFTEAQIMGILRQVEGGLALADVCREHAVSSATFYKWRSKYGGVDKSMITDMRVIASEISHVWTGPYDLGNQKLLLIKSTIREIENVESLLRGLPLC